MIMIILASKCYPIDFDVEELDETNVAVIVQLSNQGLNNYIEKNAKAAIAKIQGTLKLPTFVIPLSVFQITLGDGVFKDLKLENVSTVFSANQTRIFIGNITIDVYFKLEILQKTFPYLSDSGSLQIQVSQFSLGTDCVVSFQDENCRNKYTVTTINPVIEVNYFEFQFTSGLQIILNSLAKLLNGVLKEQLNGELGLGLVGSVMQELIKLLLSLQPFARVSFEQSISTDQRYIYGIDISKNFLTVKSSGQRCLYTAVKGHEKCSGHIPQSVQPPPFFITNNEVQYKIEKSAFNSGLQYYLKTERIFSGIKIKNITLDRFVNTGAQIFMDIEVNDVSERLEFLEPMTFYSLDVLPLMTYASFQFNLTNMLKGSLSKQQVKQLNTEFKTSYQYHELSYGNSLGVSVEKAYAIYLNEDWVMFVSDIDG